MIPLFHFHTLEYRMASSHMWSFRSCRFESSMRIILPPHKSNTIYNDFFSDCEVSIMSCTLIAPLTGDGPSTPVTSLMLQCQGHTPPFQRVSRNLYTPLTVWKDSWIPACSSWGWRFCCLGPCNSSDPSDSQKASKSQRTKAQRKLFMRTDHVPDAETSEKTSLLGTFTQKLEPFKWLYWQATGRLFANMSLSRVRPITHLLSRDQ